MPAGRRTWILFVSLVLVSVSLGACRSRMASEVAPSQYAGKTLYTQFGMRHENKRYRTTNYQVGILLPVNSQVEVRGMDSRSARLYVLPSGPEVVVENVEKHTAQTMADAVAEMVREQPIDLSGFSADEQTYIREGRVVPGMRKSAVLAAIGPPPAIGTPTRDSNEWKYWRSRFTTFILRFDGDVLAEQIGR